MTNNFDISLVQKAIDVGRTHFSPRELVDWFHGNFDAGIEIELTLHPKDPCSLLVVLHPRSQHLQVVYAFSDAPNPQQKEEPTTCHLQSSKPRSNPKQAHFFKEMDMLDVWAAKAMAALNRSHVIFPVPLVTIGAMIWKSLSIMLSTGPNLPCVHQFVAENDESAVEKVLSWSELAQRVHVLATVLSNTYHVAHGDFVIQFVQRSFDQIVGMLAIFTVGGVYVPLAASPNPDPPARIAKVVSDCCPKMILTQSDLEPHMKEACRLANKETIPIHCTNKMCEISDVDLTKNGCRLRTNMCKLFCRQCRVLHLHVWVDFCTESCCAYTSKFQQFALCLPFWFQ